MSSKRRARRRWGQNRIKRTEQADHIGRDPIGVRSRASRAFLRTRASCDPDSDSVRSRALRAFLRTRASCASHTAGKPSLRCGRRAFGKPERLETIWLADHVGLPANRRLACAFALACQRAAGLLSRLAYGVALCARSYARGPPVILTRDSVRSRARAFLRTTGPCASHTAGKPSLRCGRRAFGRPELIRLADHVGLRANRRLACAFALACQRAAGLLSFVSAGES
jgi:hypothetical protein